MLFRPCPSGCGCFLSADDGHDRCLQSLGFQDAEDAFVDDPCACCGRMSMTSLQSRLSFLKGLAPSATTRAVLSGSSRGPPAGALGDLRVTVTASLPGTSPWTSYSSRRNSSSWVISLVRPTGRPAFHSVRHLRIGCRSQHRGMGLRPLRMKVRWSFPPWEHISPVLISLHWLPVKYRIHFKSLLFVYKGLHGLAPSYISDLLFYCNASRELRSNSSLKLTVPRTRLKLKGDRAFSVAAPQLWNNLPSYIRSAPTYADFKFLLKTYLFTVAYGLK